ncbi:MAG: hypothetical protein ACKVGZ_07695 [Alphaproteobacteria bacterium]
MSKVGAFAPQPKLPAPKNWGREQFVLTARTVVIGTCGGALFAYIGTPLPG